MDFGEKFWFKSKTSGVGLTQILWQTNQGNALNPHAIGDRTRMLSEP
jgi:hypothetical protein